MGDAAWLTPCSLDSAGFSAMVQWGGYPWSVQQHVDFVRTNGGRWRMPLPWQWWAAMDYCCEQKIASHRAEVMRRMALTIATAEETLEQVEAWWEEGDLDLTYPLLTLQGRTPADYVWSAHEIARIWKYRQCRELPELLGVGSVCTRALHGPEGLLPVLDAIHAELPRNVRLHLFGIKGDAMKCLDRYDDRIASVDSMAWDVEARRDAQHIRKKTGMEYSCDLPHRASVMARWYARTTSY